MQKLALRQTVSGEAIGQKEVSGRPQCAASTSRKVGDCLLPSRRLAIGRELRLAKEKRFRFRGAHFDLLIHGRGALSTFFEISTLQSFHIDSHSLESALLARSHLF